MVISQSADASYNITNITTSGKRSFTYYDGYGGIGNKYCLSGYPTHWDYTPYSISGTWSP